MGTVSASEARARLYRHIDEAASSREPIPTTGKRANDSFRETAGRLERERGVKSVGATP